MTRLEKLEAVVDAARVVVKVPICREPTKEILALADALAALDADAEAQTVTLAVWRYEDGSVVLSEAASEDDTRRGDWTSYTRLGPVTLPLNRERGA